MSRVLIGPAACQACGSDVWLVREPGSTAWCEPRAGRGRMWKRHACRPRCGALMRYAGERCARLAGHAAEHRSRYALENARRAA